MHNYSSCMAVVGILWASLAGASSIKAENHTVEAVHSAVLFKIKHLGASYAYGRFNEFSGTLSLGGGDDSVDISVKAESVDTANAKRDQHLRGPDFFGAKQFPVIRFKSDKVKQAGASTYEAAGKLTLHGVTRDLTVRFERVGSGKDQGGNTKTGFHGVFKIKRSDFGMKYGLGGIGDEVEITVSLECATA